MTPFLERCLAPIFYVETKMTIIILQTAISIDIITEKEIYIITKTDFIFRKMSKTDIGKNVEE